MKARNDCMTGCKQGQPGMLTPGVVEEGCIDLGAQCRSEGLLGSITQPHMRASLKNLLRSTLCAKEDKQALNIEVTEN